MTPIKYTKDSNLSIHLSYQKEEKFVKCSLDYKGLYHAINFILHLNTSNNQLISRTIKDLNEILDTKSTCIAINGSTRLVCAYTPNKGFSLYDINLIDKPILKHTPLEDTQFIHDSIQSFIDNHVNETFINADELELLILLKNMPALSQFMCGPNPVNVNILQSLQQKQLISNTLEHHTLTKKAYELLDNINIKV